MTFQLTNLVGVEVLGSVNPNPNNNPNLRGIILIGRPLLLQYSHAGGYKYHYSTDTLGTRQKCPYIAGGRSSQGWMGRRGTPNIIHLAILPTNIPPAIFLMNTRIVIIMYAIVVNLKLMQHNN